MSSTSEEQIQMLCSILVQYSDKFMHTIVLYSIVLRRSQLYSIVLLIYCYVDIIQYNGVHKFVGVLDNPQIISYVESNIVPLAVVELQ